MEQITDLISRQAVMEAILKFAPDNAVLQQAIREMPAGVLPPAEAPVCITVHKNGMVHVPSAVLRTLSDPDAQYVSLCLTPQPEIVAMQFFSEKPNRFARSLFRAGADRPDKRFRLKEATELLSGQDAQKTVLRLVKTQGNMCFFHKV